MFKQIRVFIIKEIIINHTNGHLTTGACVLTLNHGIFIYISKFAPNLFDEIAHETGHAVFYQFPLTRPIRVLNELWDRISLLIS